MSLMQSKYMALVAALLTLMAGLFLAFYYWTNSSLGSIRFVPFHILIIAFAYILLQLIKRRFIRTLSRKWWDWLYYPGLLSMILPLYFATESNLSLWNLLSDIGIAFLIITPLLDLKLIFFKP